MQHSIQRMKNMRMRYLLSAVLALALAGCGGEDAFTGGTGGTGGTGANAVESITLVTGSPTLSSDGVLPAEITAYVRNASNQFINNVPVTFSATSGGLLVTQGTTDSNGVAKASLTSAGDPTSRSITVTARAGDVTSTVTVDVSGSTLTVQGPSDLTLNQVGTYRVSLLDGANRAIAGRTVTITSSRSNTLSASSVTTDTTGGAEFTLTAVNGGNDTLTLSGLGLIATQTVAVNSDSFTVTAPAPNTEVALSTPQTVTARWLVGGSPVVGQTISFATTRGTLSAATAVTDGTGTATTSVSATSAGGAIVTASSGSSSANVPIEFVATTPVVIDIQPTAFSIGPNQSSTLTAVVRDGVGNLVKNKVVVFTLNDVTGGTLSVGTATTNSQGRAQTVYTASSTTSANQGVKITASVQGFPAVIPVQVSLTVARREVFISLGTGNEIAEPNAAQYQVTYVVQVTDASGNGVAGVPVSLRVLSQRYYKGNRVAGVATWTTSYTVAGGCADEDVDRDGILDPTEDFNTSGRIEAGNIVSVSPANAVTNADGFVLAQVYYPQEYAYYVDVSLAASATVTGTEYSRTSNFKLAGSSADFSDITKAPPGITSPFGTAGVCTNPN
jgi:hypothetical protein